MATISIQVNGTSHVVDAEQRTLLVELLREHLRLTGTHVGCDTSQCGACTVWVDGKSVKSCTMLAAEADAHEKDADAASLAEMVRRQVTVMRRQVDHYLSRARAAGSLDVLGNRTQGSSVVEDLARVIERIHMTGGIRIEATSSR